MPEVAEVVGENISNEVAWCPSSIARDKLGPSPVEDYTAGTAGSALVEEYCPVEGYTTGTCGVYLSRKIPRGPQGLP